MVVSATRTEQAVNTLPSHVSVMGAPEIAATPAQSVPDMLRKIPGFTTRDFQSGLILGPSQSIVSFRGLGGSSAGRTLILLDGLPAGDPFSGWLDWGRIPLPLLQSAEVVRGGGSPIWGSRALGGVVNLRTVSPTKDEARLMFEGGSNTTFHGAGAGSLRRGKVTATVAADVWNTKGFVLLREEQAGPVDDAEGRTSRTATANVTYDVTNTLQTWIAGGIYDGGGFRTRTTTTSRSTIFAAACAGSARAGASRPCRSSATGGARSGGPTRSTRPARPTPDRYQDSPADSRGMSLQWTQMAFGLHELTAGADVSSASGSLFESFNFVNNVATSVGMSAAGDSRRRSSGRGRPGTRRAHAGQRVRRRCATATGAHAVRAAQRDGEIGHGVRRPHDEPGVLLVRPALAAGAATCLARQRVRVVPRPSMYEMYQPRYSNRGTITESNASLEQERLRGAELGVDLTLGNGFVGRLTAFRNHVDSPIMDVTIGVAGAQPTPIVPCGTVLVRRRAGSGRMSTACRATASRRSWTGALVGVDARRRRQLHPHARVRARQAAGRQMGDPFGPSRDHRLGWVRQPALAWRRRRGPLRRSRFDNDLNTIELAECYLVGLRLNRSLGRGMTGAVQSREPATRRSRSRAPPPASPRWARRAGDGGYPRRVVAR